MPQITSCPECSKKLRVPDDLIGKKVKCPGCTTMFIAEADEEEQEAPPAPAPRKRSDAVTSSPRSAPRSRDADDDEEERPRSRRDEEEEEDRGSRRSRNGDQRVRSRRDEDDEPRPRARRNEDEEEDDRRVRSRRDEDEEDDRRSRRRRDDDDDDDEGSPRQQVTGWQRVRMGINFVAISGWISMSILGIYLIAAGIMLIFGGGMIGAFLTGNPRAAVGGMGVMVVGMFAFMIFVGLLGLTSMALLLTGVGMSMSIPKLRGSSMRTLAISAFSCYAAFIALYLLGAVGGQISLGMALLGGMMQLTGLLAGFIGHILWMILLRSICLHFYDEQLAGTVMTNLIVQIVSPFVMLIVMVIMGVIIGVSMAGAQTAGGAVTSLGVGMVIGIILYGLMLLAMLGIYLWYILTLQKVRDLVEYQASRL